MASPHNDAPFFEQKSAFNTMSGAIGELIQAKLERLGPSMLVKVVAVHNEGVSITGSVDVQPLVQQQDARGRPVRRAVIRNVPYLRIQGGTSALIVDPQIGDIGFAIVAGRDMNHTISTRDEAPPASNRTYSISDAVYVGGFLGDAPAQYIQATANGWRIVTPGTVSIEAAGITANCDFTTTGDVKAGGISLKQHTHGGVQTGGSKTTPPQ